MIKPSTIVNAAFLRYEITLTTAWQMMLSGENATTRGNINHFRQLDWQKRIQETKYDY